MFIQTSSLSESRFNFYLIDFQGNIFSKEVYFKGTDQQDLFAFLASLERPRPEYELLMV